MSLFLFKNHENVIYPIFIFFFAIIRLKNGSLQNNYDKLKL